MGTEFDNTWVIKVLVNSNNIMVNVPKDCQLKTLISAIAAKLPPRTPDEIVITYAGKTLSMQETDLTSKKLSELKLKDGSLVVLAFRLPGGVWPINALRIKKQTLEPLPGFITITTTEPDMIFPDDSTDRRAKMPCGHVIGPSSMTSYCQSLLSAGKYTFPCPYVIGAGKTCGQNWPFFLVRHVACLSGEELEKFEKQASENALMKSTGFQQCPGCSNWCCQAEPRNKCVRCLECTRNNGGVPFDFCWDCLGKWQHYVGGAVCGNQDCNGAEKKLAILASCDQKHIEGVACPSIRACPKCGMLIEHKAECKHMTCECSYAFCFFCLKPRAADGMWPCIAYMRDCRPAPRQTTLPTSK